MTRKCQYNHSNIQKSLLSCWLFFDKEEKSFFYNPSSDTYYLGIKKSQNTADCPYLLYPMHFFFGQENPSCSGKLPVGIAFEYYWIVKNGETIYKNIPSTFEDSCIGKIEHTYTNNSNDYEEWKELFSNIFEKIQNKEVKKVVASRKVEIVCEFAINVESVLLNLLEKNTESFVFAYHKSGETFLGASPEVLVEKQGSHITSYALAGTITKTEENKKEQGAKLLHDEKNNHEHRIVAESIASVMKSQASSVEVGEIRLMELRNLFHLKTNISAHDDTLALLDWVKLLHPTPAMGGEPRERALQIIQEYEKHERGMYAAPFGIVDTKGDGIFVVGIRSGLVVGNTIYAYAGCGIVAQSDCDEEYKETNSKLRTILECL